MTSAGQGPPYSRGYRPGAGFKTGDFVKEMLGGGYRRMPHWHILRGACSVLAARSTVIEVARLV